MTDENGHLNALLPELHGLEASLEQLQGMAKQESHEGDAAAYDKYQKEFQELSLKRQDLIEDIEAIKRESAALSEEQRSSI